MNKKYLIIIIIFFTIIACRKKSELENLIPEKLGDLELEQVENTAENFFVNLIPTTINSTTGLKAIYSNKKYLTYLYISAYKDTLSAITAFHHLMRELREDSLNYKHFIPRFDENMFFIMAFKDDRLNYFFTKSNHIYWLNCQKRSGESLIKDLIRHSR